MNDLIEKLKVMEPKQLIIIGLVALTVISLFVVLLIPGEESEEPTDLDDFETPENRDQVKDYNSKLDAYNSNQNEDDRVSLEFNLDEYASDEPADDDLEREQLEKEVDSMLNANKMSYSDNSASRPKNQGTKPSTGRSTPRRTQSPEKSNRKEEINNEFESFFTNAPKSSSKEKVLDSKTDPFIYAVIHGDHTVRQGERVKLRLTKKATIADMEFSQNSYVYAFPTFQDNRVLLNIRSINHVPISISAYDTEDSALGLYVKGAKMVGEITDEGSKEAVDDVDVGGVPVGSTIKKVFQKKQQIPTVTLLNNTKLILKPNER
ncbi:conjugative transposon protein TraM [Flagellimonas hymeniacidonis]|uniref:Conjugative transposon protein TraM n=1 Tax=Flagellimonas hymeniacidonis TaxID=2603628 RepID=A0A5C8V945_9FLAO|nr:conjugative transposon protein TraM [Flagellimonas hymeniacidonis]TXN37710.1 conjugative transposon protein TraM [Flagellimonas hymeniacidonis]